MTRTLRAPAIDTGNLPGDPGCAPHDGLPR